MTSVWAAPAAEFIQYDGTNAEEVKACFGVEPGINPEDGSVTFRSDGSVAYWAGSFTLQVGDWAQVGILAAVSAADFATKFVPMPQA